MQRQIERKTFMEWPDFWRDKPIIKVITGIRRCGKTTLLELYRQKLLSEGVDERQIVSVNFEDPDPELETGRAFNDFMRFGGFPFAASLVGEPHAHSDYPGAILNTILYKEVVARVGLRDTTLRSTD